MFEARKKPSCRGTAATILLLVLVWTWVRPAAVYGQQQKNPVVPRAAGAAETTTTVSKPPDFSNVVFPPPPAIARVKYLDYFSAEKPQPLTATKKAKKKRSWMDRMAGTSAIDTQTGESKPRFQLIQPYGLAVDSKGRLYAADTKVRAIFIFNTENNEVELIKAGGGAKFGSILGLAMDDNDNLLVSDGELGHVLVFDAQHKLLAGFGDGTMRDPNGIAIDTENRILYVADAGLDQVLVYDADTYKLLRRIGTTGKDHTLTDAGDFSKPTNVAVDKDGNLYVSDTANDRVEVFDGDGAFVRTWGKNGDGPGDFERPKGIAIDSDGHVWVVDAMLNRLQVFTPEGHLLLAIGGFGIGPGQFAAPTGLTIDNKLHRIFTSEQMLGRTQMFRYITNAEAKAELQRREEELAKKAQERKAQTSSTPGAKPQQPDEVRQAAPASKPPEPQPAPPQAASPPPKN